MHRLCTFPFSKTVETQTTLTTGFPQLSTRFPQLSTTSMWKSFVLFTCRNQSYPQIHKVFHRCNYVDVIHCNQQSCYRTASELQEFLRKLWKTCPKLPALVLMVCGKLKHHELIHNIVKVINRFHVKHSTPQNVFHLVKHQLSTKHTAPTATTTNN